MSGCMSSETGLTPLEVLADFQYQVEKVRNDIALDLECQKRNNYPDNGRIAQESWLVGEEGEQIVNYIALKLWSSWHKGMIESIGTPHPLAQYLSNTPTPTRVHEHQMDGKLIDWIEADIAAKYVTPPTRLEAFIYDHYTGCG